MKARFRISVLMPAHAITVHERPDGRLGPAVVPVTLIVNRHVSRSRRSTSMVDGHFSPSALANTSSSVGTLGRR